MAQAAPVEPSPQPLASHAEAQAETQRQEAAEEHNLEASVQAPSHLAHYEQRDRHDEGAAVVEEDLPEADEVEEEEMELGESEDVVAAAQPPARPRRPTEEIDVQAVLRQHSDAQPAARPGVVEEEEIEEEEPDAPPFPGGLDEADFEELEMEEETLDRLEDSNGNDSPVAAEVAAASGTSAEAADHEAAEGEEEEHDEADLAHDAVMESEGTPSAAGASTEAAPQQQRRGFDRGRGRRGRPHGRPGRPGRRMHRGPLPLISDLLKEGQEVLVQIAKEPIAKKGARITSHIALPGRFLVYMPTVNHNGVSRKISSDDERRRLKRIIASEHQTGQGGFIVRTAAASAGEEDLRADIRFLLNLWREIKQRADEGKPPALIYHDLNLVERILRDQVSEGFSHIWVDTEQEYERVLRFINRFQPQLVKRVKLYTKETPLFEQFNIQEEINKSLKSKVWLKSGGYIVINQTEALVAIDVNTGKYVGRTQRLEDTIVKTNVDAIREIVRQIRLRDLGGIIVIDFIDMDERRNRSKVMQALEEALKADRAPSKVLQFNDFGLVAITRKRVKQSLERTLGQPCTYCTGTGLIKSSATICNEIYVEMRKMARHLERGDVILRVNPEVGKALKANNARWLADLEELTGRTVIVKPDATLHQEQFDIH